MYRSFHDHLKAAKAVSKHLDSHGLPHAYIGGFAWSLLGSSRPTEMSIMSFCGGCVLTCNLFVDIHDIDVLVDAPVKDMVELRDKLLSDDERFADLGVKLYFINEDHVTDESREDRVRRSLSNVLVETLCTGTLGLPAVAGPIYQVTDHQIPILHPRILILTKFKRWSVNHTSTRPKTIRKTLSDRNDINFIIEWLAGRLLTIWFDHYKGKSKPELLLMIRLYHDKYAEQTDLMDKLQIIMLDDWETMLALPVPKEEAQLPP